MACDGCKKFKKPKTNLSQYFWQLKFRVNKKYIYHSNFFLNVTRQCRNTNLSLLFLDKCILTSRTVGH